MICEDWEKEGSLDTSLPDHMVKQREQLQRVQQIARENLAEAQAKQKGTYGKRAKICEFTAGDKVLLVLLDHNSKLLAQ